MTRGRLIESDDSRRSLARVVKEGFLDSVGNQILSRTAHLCFTGWEHRGNENLM